MNGTDTILMWKTASETDNAGFAVERRVFSNGKYMDFKKVGFVEGQGTTTRSQNYRFQDEGIAYSADSVAYRLKQFDTDGRATSSREIVIRRGIPGQTELRGPYPHPASLQVTIPYTVTKETRVTIEIYDLLGRTIKRLIRGTQKAGYHQVQVDATQLSSGTYFVQMQTNGFVDTERLTVVR
jgi:hypothetical protein